MIIDLTINVVQCIQQRKEYNNKGREECRICAIICSMLGEKLPTLHKHMHDYMYVYSVYIIIAKSGGISQFYTRFLIKAVLFVSQSACLKLVFSRHHAHISLYAYNN